MQKVKIIIDTSADMPQDILEKYGFGKVNFHCIFGEEDYIAEEELTTAQFYEKLESSPVMPKTSQTPYATLYDTFKKEALENDAVLFITLSGKASGQANTARMVADEVMEKHPGTKVVVCDTESFSILVAAGAIAAKEAIDEGKSVEEAAEIAKKEANSWGAYIVVDDLNYLQKGGRITKTASIVGTLLDIKPVLTVRDGLIEPLEKMRGKKNIFKKLAMLVKSQGKCDYESQPAMIICSSESGVAEVEAAMRENLGVKDFHIKSVFGPIIGTHIGTGGYAMVFKLKGDKKL